MRRLGTLSTVAALTLAACPRSLLAQGGEAKAIARSRALEGSRVADQGQHERALELFREAYALYPEPAYLYDIGVECQALGRDVDALDAYTRFLADPRGAPHSLVNHAGELQSELERKIGAIQLRGAPEGAEVDIDDEPRGSAPLREPIRTKPGVHRVVVRRLGFEPFRGEFQVPEGGTAVVDVPPLLQAEPLPSNAPERSPWLSWAFSLGVGFWTAGPPAGTGPSPTLSVGAGHALASLPGAIELQLGAKIGLTYFTEPGATDTFVSALANPRFVRSLGSRFGAFADVGLGVLVLAGTPDNSVLLEAQGGRVTGALTTFELRPAIGAAYAVSETIALQLAPAFVWNPSPSARFAHASLTRLEVALGLTGEL